MADANVFSEIGGQLASKIMGSILYVGIAIILIGAICFAIWYFLVYSKKFDIIVHIKSKRADDKYSVIIDKAAILKDFKTNIKFFRIWNLQKDFPAPKFNILQATNKGDLLELYREGENIFSYLTPPRIDSKHIIKSDGRIYAIATQEQLMVDPDMDFWLKNRDASRKKMFDTEGLVMKLLPYLPLLLGGMIMIFMLYILMDNLPTLMQEMQKLAQVMTNMQKAEVISGG